MGLALHFLLILLIEMPIIGLFFKKRRRGNALKYAFLVNMISWPIMEIIRINQTEVNLLYIQIAIAVGEGIAYWIFLDCGWKRAFMIAFIANAISFMVTKQVPYDLEIFSNKPNIILHK